VVLSHATTDRTYYRRQPYDPEAVVESWRQVHASGVVPAVTRIEAPPSRDGRLHLPVDRNESLTRGASQLGFYEPLFGYRTELFPYGNIRPGPAEALVEERLNVKNPAYFLFPEENGGSPGEHFRFDQRDDARAFLTYRPFRFVSPARQRLADALNVMALVAFAALLCFHFVRSVRRVY
jgi:hypothetical protein